MSPKKVFDAMEGGDWKKVNELIAATTWTPQDLERKHGGVKQLIFQSPN
jgi:hypothetical protein